MKFINYDVIKDYPIEEYARIAGFTVIKKGSYYSLKEHESIRIDPKENLFYRNSSGQAGSVIDFAMWCENNEIDHHEAAERIKTLQGFSDSCYEADSATLPTRHTVREDVEKKPLILPEKAPNMRRVFAYLSQTRGIDADIISEWMHRDNLYQDLKGNCVFVSRDESGNPVFASQRGTHTEKRFVADLAGSDYSKCFQINNNANTLVVAESTIDLMSVQDVMKRNGRDLQNYSFMSINGVSKLNAIERYSKEHPEVNNIVLAYDNDEAGINGIQSTREMLSENGYTGNIKEFLPRNCKDWNDQLKLYNEQRQIKLANNTLSGMEM